MGLPLRKSKVILPTTCPLSECLSLLRGAWAPNVIWHLSGEPRRFSELRHDIPRISARVLSARLRELESRGLITRRALDTSPPSVEYALTEHGHELLPAIETLAKIGYKLIQKRNARMQAGQAGDPMHDGPCRAGARRGMVAQTSSEPSLTPSNRNVER